VSTLNEKKYNEALQYRPETIKRLFPDSKALIVSGKVIHATMVKLREEGIKCMTISANGRNEWVIEGALRAADRTNSAIIIEIAKSECNYCPVNFDNIAKKVNDIIEKFDLKVVVAVHADHYAIKSEDDMAPAKKQIPQMIDNGITSIAIDASHLLPHENVLANIELANLIPSWISLETEVGEIKGAQGLSTPEDALYHIGALNAYGVFPTWIALNNGSVHGLEATGGNIDADVTAEVHNAIHKYGVYGAQHGTSGNNYEKLGEIVQKTNTTKANVATALQMISWGVKVNEYGNALTDENGDFVKDENAGMNKEAWEYMVNLAKELGFKGGNYKKLNKPADEYLKKLPEDIQRRMAKGVEDFIANLLENVFNAKDSAHKALDVILEHKSHEIEMFNKIIEDKNKWTKEYIIEEGKRIYDEDNAIEGDFDD